MDPHMPTVRPATVAGIFGDSDTDVREQRAGRIGALERLDRIGLHAEHGNAVLIRTVHQHVDRTMQRDAIGKHAFCALLSEQICRCIQWSVGQLE